MPAMGCIVARLEGEELDRGANRYLELVRRGVAGFVVFGGRLESLRDGLARLQQEAGLMGRPPLVIASDLEQGLGQQVRGGTLFPPAMAVAAAGDRNLARAAFRQMAREAAYAGINTILAPVLDVDTNPDNPIIATRAFSGDPGTVASLGADMVRAFRAECVASCGKHFPGHGDTAVDSHLSLPVVSKPREGLEQVELVPFRRAVAEGVDLMMLGHLRVPALDPTGVPASCSSRVVGYLRQEVGFKGLVLTDAMNMGGVGDLGEEEASIMALDAGVDLILHPSDPEGLASALAGHAELIDEHRLFRFRNRLYPGPVERTGSPAFEAELTEELTERCVRATGSADGTRLLRVIVLSDDEAEDGSAFMDELWKTRSDISCTVLREGHALPPSAPDQAVAVFSSVRPWKGGTAQWLRSALSALGERAHVFVSFGTPHLLDHVPASALKVFAWWGAEGAQRAAARRLLSKSG